jgi:two-component system catabolic regulation response regulator CreB
MHLFKILLIDDEPAITDSLGYALERAQFSCQSATSLQEADLLFEKDQFHLVVLDLTLGDGHGFDWLRKIRQLSQVPVIILSSHDEEIEHIVGLELGADDYINKPFSPREVVARVRAVLRRTQTLANAQVTSSISEQLNSPPEPTLSAVEQSSIQQSSAQQSSTQQSSTQQSSTQQSSTQQSSTQQSSTQQSSTQQSSDSATLHSTLRHQPLVMNKEMYLVWVYGSEVVLSHLEFELLYFLYQKPNFVFTRDTLLDRVWGDEVVISERTVDVHIKAIRKKLTQAGLEQDAIETIRGVGYKFVPIKK